jgi:hypothetical protein
VSTEPAAAQEGLHQHMKAWIFRPPFIASQDLGSASLLAEDVANIAISLLITIVVGAFAAGLLSLTLTVTGVRGKISTIVGAIIMWPLMIVVFLRVHYGSPLTGNELVSWAIGCILLLGALFALWVGIMTYRWLRKVTGRPR